ncbi:LysR substrate-binding domain-containing protein [Burkholderia ubonensis]|uniref:LysR substrate-binding domain-containing protein n=1 Tax=Burkholderia ubonensis TaxID=101571 RepID=UPI0039F55AE1
MGVPQGWNAPGDRCLCPFNLGHDGSCRKGRRCWRRRCCVEQREAQQFLDNGTLVQVLAEWAPPFAGEALYYRRMRLPSAAFRAFIDYVKEWKRTRETTQGHQSK